MECVTVFDDDRLLVPDKSVAEGLISASGFSPSSFDALESCPARWVADRVYRGPADAFSPAVVGSGAHKVLELFYAADPAERTDEFFHECLYSVANNPKVNDSQRADWREEVYQASKSIFKIEDPAEINVLGTEIQLKNVDVGGVPFNGFVDRLRDNNGLVYVEDYKTSQKMQNPFFGDSHGDQQRLYIHALRNMGYDIAGANLLYTRIGKIKKVNTSKSAMRDVLQRFQAAWDGLNQAVDNQSFATSPSPLCGWCPLVNVCPSAQGEDRSGAGIDPEFFTLSAPVKTPPPLPHTKGSADENVEREIEMFAEDVPYRKTLRNGQFNIGSYAAGGFLHLVQIACDLLLEAGLGLRRTQVLTLAGLLGDLVADVQRQFTGSVDVQDNLNKNIRWQLVHNLPNFPVPFGADEDAWADWREGMFKRLMVQVQLMTDLVDVQMDGDGDFAVRAAEVFAGACPDPWVGQKE